MMKQFKLSQQKTGLVVIAHPDDETIWLAGLILLSPKINWTVLCLSRSGDADRAPKFKQVAKKLNFKYYHEDLDDMEKFSFQKHVHLAKNLITKNIGTASFDFIITHGSNGEYGHRDHKSIHEAVCDLLIHSKLNIPTALFLHYKKPHKKIPLLIPRSKADLIIKLPSKIFKTKIDIMSKIYGFDSNGIDASYCTRVEAFKIKRYN